MMVEAKRRTLPVRGIGVAVPGIVNDEGGRVWAPNIPGWDCYPLGDELRAAIGNSAINVAVDSDRAACILGEAWQGAARSCRDAIFLAVGTGIGVGVIAEGQVLRGAHGIAGAIGWMALDRPFDEQYARWGCFESRASGEGLARATMAALATHPNYRGDLGATPQLTAHEVFAAYERGDEIAVLVLSQAVELWGMAAANLVSLFNPEKFIFGGGIFGPARRFLDEIAAEARRWSQPAAIERVSFEPSQLGGDAALYGAAYLALHGRRLKNRA
jgi:glucokinase